MGKSKRKSHYAVARGRNVGIYRTWYARFTPNSLIDSNSREGSWLHQSAGASLTVAVGVVTTGRSARLKCTATQVRYSRAFKAPAKLATTSNSAL